MCEAQFGLSATGARPGMAAEKQNASGEFTGPRLTPLEIASCVVVGPAPSRPVLPPEARAAEPVTVLERVVARALQRPPCLVSFSGGHDSSLVLAAATRAARREQLPLPVPVTWRVTGAPRAEESDRQEAVVAALRIADWVRLKADDDLDFVGPVAARVLRRHGLLHPANAYAHAPLLKQAAGGTLLTGVGGDQVLGRLPRPRRPWWCPRPDGSAVQFGWLRPAAARHVRNGLRREQRARPTRYEDRPTWAMGRRDLELTRLSLARLGHDTDTEAVHPLLDPEFLAAICRPDRSPETDGGRAGLLGRVFGGSYPDAVLRPRPKATFAEVYWRRHTRSVLAAWDGGGVDPLVVDRTRLRREWDRPQPDLCTAMLVQQVWLATTAASSA
jgi:hypothetical protein